MYTALNYWSSYLPCVEDGVPLLHPQGKSQAKWLVHRKICTIDAFTQVNSEDRDALAKLVDAIRANYNDR